MTIPFAIDAPPPTPAIQKTPDRAVDENAGDGSFEQALGDATRETRPTNTGRPADAGRPSRQVHHASEPHRAHAGNEAHGRKSKDETNGDDSDANRQAAAADPDTDTDATAKTDGETSEQKATKPDSLTVATLMPALLAVAPVVTNQISATADADADTSAPADRTVDALAAVGRPSTAPSTASAATIQHAAPVATAPATPTIETLQSTERSQSQTHTEIAPPPTPHEAQPDHPLSQAPSAVAPAPASGQPAAPPPSVTDQPAKADAKTTFDIDAKITEPRLSDANSTPAIVAAKASAAPSPIRPSTPEPSAVQGDTPPPTSATAAVAPVSAVREGTDRAMNGQSERETARDEQGQPVIPAPPASVESAHERFAVPPSPSTVTAPSVEPHVAPPVMPIQHDALPVSPLKSIQFAVNPPEIGPVNVRVVVSDQRVFASVATERSDVGQFLLNNQSQLQAGLQAYGLDLSSFRVDVDTRGPGNQGWSFGPAPDPAATARTVPSEPESEVPPSSATWLERGRVNVFA